MNEPTHVYLDPDGTEGAGVVVVVEASTNVVYGSQVGGHATEDRWIEGFAIPLFNPQHLQGLEAFFRRYHGNPPYPGTKFSWWTDADLQELTALVERIPLWHGDQRAFLAFDRTRLDELTEGWIPVFSSRQLHFFSVPEGIKAGSAGEEGRGASRDPSEGHQ